MTEVEILAEIPDRESGFVIVALDIADESFYHIGVACLLCFEVGIQKLKEDREGVVIPNRILIDVVMKKPLKQKPGIGKVLTLDEMVLAGKAHFLCIKWHILPQ